MTYDIFKILLVINRWILWKMGGNYELGTMDWLL
jgi:hypothetical protein